ncbi:MAG: redoxin domain-containing protein [Candidatus Eisenbacteria bacterium]|uniref:Redoxin domain-containing protein n=1 Tax=Eiseniibacteriota bacterium TaxID=2212470 RepID=A0A956LVY0_UNCEI|nr:redoxin domain-containing protein [Candidatus Eisenbacteria bacterium]
MAALCALPLPSRAAADAELAAIAARPASRTQTQDALLNEWWKQGPNVSAEFVGRAREEALRDPRANEMMELYIQAAIAQGDTTRLERDLASLERAHPDDACFPYYRGLTLMPEEGTKAFQRALALDPDYAPALVAQAGLDLSAQEPALDQARTRLLQAARLDPGNYRTFYLLGQVYRRTGDEDSRLLALRRGVEIEPESPRPRQALLQALQEGASAAQKTGSIQTWAEETATFLEELAADVPGQSSLLYTAARVSMSTGARERSLADLDAALTAGFDDPISLESDGTFASLRQSGQLAPLVERARANRVTSEPALRAELRTERIDLEAPDFTLTRQGGGTVKLSELRGKVVILDFWATWCGPCRKALPVLQTYFENKPENVEVFCVNVFERDGGRSIESFWTQGKFPMPVLLGTNDTAEAYSVRSIPTLFVIGPDGKIGYRHQGFSPYLAEQLRWMSEDLLGL